MMSYCYWQRHPFTLNVLRAMVDKVLIDLLMSFVWHGELTK